MERFRCAACENVLSVPVRLVPLPAAPDSALLHYGVNAPRLEPLTYAVDEAEFGWDLVTGTFVLSPGDVRGIRYLRAGRCGPADDWFPDGRGEPCFEQPATATRQINVTVAT